MSFQSEIIAEYTTSNDAPIASLTVTNPDAYRNLKLSVDTKGGNLNPRTRRVKIETSSGAAVFLPTTSIITLIDALERIRDFGIDGAAA